MKETIIILQKTKTKPNKLQLSIVQNSKNNYNNNNVNNNENNNNQGAVSPSASLDHH